jgi:BirA family biotin operon repressor/biotin-[acetyl-CoA-carboxylase] ligase
LQSVGQIGTKLAKTLYKIPAKTFFIGKNLIYVPQCHSTNVLAAQILQQPSAHEGIVVITDKQTKGRGQRGNLWITEPGKNLTFSIILKPAFLIPVEQFHLTIAISLGIVDCIKSFFKLTASIKWPNDIIVGGKKVAGILTENQLRGNKIIHSIVGIGLNVNQESLPIATAASLFQMTGKSCDLSLVLNELLEHIESRYIMLRNGRTKELTHDYLKVLYWKDEEHVYFSKGKRLKGVIKGISKTGKLVVETDHGEQLFDIKEIEYLV